MIVSQRDNAAAAGLKSCATGILGAAAVLIAVAAPVTAQTGANVLLVINTASPASQQIGKEYAAARSIPDAQIVQVRTAVVDEIDRAVFEADIERPISETLTRGALQDQILYIVLTKDIPLRVRGTVGITGTVASVDSELALVYRKLLGVPVPPAGRIDNPYFAQDRPLTEAKPFSHATHDIYLVTRLDGYTVADVLALIKKGTSPVREGAFVLDQRANLLGNRAGDSWLAQAAERLGAAGLADRVRLETSSTPAAATVPVLGYYSWGSNDTGITTRKPELTFAPGALAGMFVSTDARTLKEPPAEWKLGEWRNPKTHFGGSPQSLIGDLIRQGATGVAGHVAEPFLDGSARPQILFPAYVAGFNLAEAYYLSLPFLSWQNIIVGDPLCAPFRPSGMVAASLKPSVDPETELPEFFSARRLAVLSSHGVRREVAGLMLKASARLLHADIKGAAQTLEAVTAIEPTLNAAHFVLASIYDVTGEHDKAIARFKTILATNPNEVRSLNNLAYTLAVNKGQPSDALAFAVKAYSIAHDTDVQLVLDVGYAMAARKGTPPNVLPFSPSGYNATAIRAQIADTLGWVHHLLGNQTDAAKYIYEAAKGAPANADVQFHLASLEHSRNRREAAIEALTKAIELEPKLLDREDVKKLRSALHPK